ncbi:GNAT family N-acetyltransferase [Alteribacter lacisalsi]|uniref:GNAT family N-acetyltransferase n=1 Tax=Alteribacter lacisalsi TaxID=2045244 RepID=A0A2W0H8G0_9BACI|nr:GNAT family N-acetyltransferase [Alteribacter lacisalsi]PYZ96370.1 GNAT family N-acetyltransferase [Alteribacter lacisalsi]
MNPVSHHIEYREFDPAADRIDQLTQVLNLAYKQLADMGLYYVAASQGSDVTLKRIQHARCFIAVADGGIIGTISYYKPGTKTDCRWYSQPGVGVVGQFGILPSWQGSGVGGTLLEMAERAAEKSGACELALDTAETADHLIDYYQKRGYRFVAQTNWEATNYRSVILSKKLRDFHNGSVKD